MLVTELPSAAWLSINADVALPAPWPRAMGLRLICRVPVTTLGHEVLRILL